MHSIFSLLLSVFIVVVKPGWQEQLKPPLSKVIYPKYSKHLPYTVAYTIDCVCNEMLNHGLNHGFFSLTFQAYTLPHTLNCMCVSLVFEFHI